MPSNLANIGISFNPVYMIREQFKNDKLLKNGLVDLHTAAEVENQRQFDSIADLNPFLTKNARHQKVQDGDWQQLTYAGRRLTWETKFLPLRIDKEWEVTQSALDDPMSPVSKILGGLVREDIYRTTLKAAAGSVQTGLPGAAPVQVDAAADGVITIDGTAGWTREKFQEIVETLLANKFTVEEMMRACAFISPTMNTDYLSIETIINRLYSSYNKSAVITEKLLDTVDVEVVAGKTDNVNYTAEQEILPVAGDTRSGVLLMPDAVAAVVEDMQLFVNEDPTTNGNYVDEKVVFARYRIGAMRKMGQRVLLLNETIQA